MKVCCYGFNLYGLFDNLADLDVLTSNLQVNFSYAVCFDANKQQLRLIVQETREDVDLAQLEHKIVQVASNDDRILLLNCVGEVFKMEIAAMQTVVKLAVIKDIKLVACGAKMTIALSNRNKLINVPNNCEFALANQIADIQVGREHCLLLIDSGDVYSFGRGSRGQLGLGHLNDESEPQLIEALAGLKMADIKTRGWHSCAVSDAGDLYLWGWNANGQLGLTNRESAVMASPSLIDFGERNVVKVACGNRHTIVLLDDGTVWGAGWNKYKQIGENFEENVRKFSKIDLGDVVDLICGPWSSFLIKK